MKQNLYHLFGASVSTILLIILALMLFSCTKDDEFEQYEYLTFFCVQKYEVLGEICYFYVAVGDTISSGRITDVDTAFVVAQTNKVPDRISVIKFHNKYCQMFCYYIDGCYKFIQCCMTASYDTTCYYNMCTAGITSPFWID